MGGSSNNRSSSSSRRATDNKPIRSENESIIRRENGSFVLRKEKVFKDGSRLVEESFIEGSELLDIEDAPESAATAMAVPLVNASIYGSASRQNPNNSGSGRSGDGEKMLQPAYNPDGWLPGIIFLMFCRYGGCAFLWWIIIRIIIAIARRNTTEAFVQSTTTTGGYDYWDPYGYESPGTIVTSSPLTTMICAIVAVVFV